MPSSWNKCATCQFWAGVRPPTTFRNRIEFSGLDAKVICARGGWNKSQKEADSSCSDCVKWGILEWPDY